MLKQSGVLKAKAAAVVAVIALVSSSGIAEPVNNPAVLSSVLKGATAGLTGSGDPTDVARADIEAKLAETAKLFEQSKAESEKRARNEAGAKKLSKYTNTSIGIDKAKAEISKSNADANKAALNSINGLPTGLTADPSVADTSQYTNSCKVKMPNAKRAMEFGGLAKSLAFLKQNLGTTLDEKAKAEGLKELENLKKAQKKIKEARNQKKQANAAQQNLASFVVPDPKSNNDLSARIARLDADWRAQKPLIEEAKDERDEAIDGFTDFLKKSLENKISIQKDAGPVLDAFESLRNDTYNDFYKGAKTAFANCQQMAVQLGQQGLDTPNTDLNTAKKWVNSFYNGQLNAKKKREFTTELTSLSQNAQCVDRADSIKSLIGANFKAEIDKARAITDPELLRQAVVTLADSLSTGIASAGTMLHGSSEGTTPVSGQVADGVFPACEAVQAKQKRTREIVASIKKQSDEARESIPFANRARGQGRGRGPGAGFPAHQGNI